MKTLIPLVVATLIQLIPSAQAQEFCIARRGIIDYSPLAEITTNSKLAKDCNHQQITARALFGIHLDEKFTRKANQAGYHVLTTFNDQYYLISTQERSEIQARELCLAYSSDEYSPYVITCEASSSMVLSTNNDAEFVRFAERYGFQILQRPEGRSRFYVLGNGR